MKWESPPLWPVVLPSAAGFILACVPYLLELPFLDEGRIRPQILVMMVFGGLLFTLPAEYGRTSDLFFGFIIGLIVLYLPMMFFPVWFIVVILIWIFQSTYIWQYNFPPFRIGLWLALGAMSGLYAGGIVAHNLL